jgi:hypothetical protein
MPSIIMQGPGGRMCLPDEKNRRKNINIIPMSTIVKDPITLFPEQIREFSMAFRTDGYEIITLDPSSGNAPEYMDTRLFDPVTHRRILNDPEAWFDYFAIVYPDRNNDSNIVPIGLYGVSAEHEIRFPLLLNEFWQAFVMTDKDTFRMICGINEADESDFYYLKLIELKRRFISRIFEYYLSIDPLWSAAMAWEIRSKRSNTRNIAESLRFLRVEDRNHEIYSSIAIPAEKWDYLKKCIIRWGIAVEKAERTNNTAEINPNVRILLREMVGYNVLVNDK